MDGFYSAWISRYAESAVNSIHYDPQRRYRLLSFRKSVGVIASPGRYARSNVRYRSLRGRGKSSNETEISFTGFRTLHALHRNPMERDPGLMTSLLNDHQCLGPLMALAL